MKIITLHKRIDPEELREHIRVNLDRMFWKQRDEEIHFTIEGSGDVIEISQPDLYEGPLFTINVKGAELNITRSEHYTDDVNSLTVESILNELFFDLAGKHGTDLLQEG
ncbi:hypothetical protein [Mucilaginibacter sp.]|jgi:hypothetical protein|uniref:hypothetical protein n=1 Tax=Mucilaginibacter sp. TaxID=1882438 RepID=UPI002D0E8060|nr:hypothetical protein [Mucilaginibacter sp.]HTI59235.1 hypothetical protein [Mucilaginibacter sp.]